MAGVLCGTGATYAFLAASAADARQVAVRLRASGTCAAIRVVRGPVPGPGRLTRSTSGYAGAGGAAA